MLTAIKSQLRRNPLLRKSYHYLRQTVELLPRQLRYRHQYYGMSQEVYDALETLKRDGIVILPEFVDPNAVTEMRRVVDESITQGRFRYGGGKIGFEEPPPNAGSIARMNVLDATLCSRCFIRYALDDFIVKVVNAYLGLDSILAGIVAYRTQPTQTSPKESFLWHYDNTPLQVKAICYLTEVAEDDGPLAFVTGTHRRRSVAATYEETRYDESKIPVEGRILCVGKPGTVLIVDTSGVHRAMPNKRGHRDVVSVLYDAGTRARRACFYNLPVPTQFIGDLRPDQRRMLRVPEYPG